MDREGFKDFIMKNIDFQLLVKNRGIYEFQISGDKSLGISYEDIKEDDNHVKAVYIYNLFCGDEYINISSYGTRDNLIPDKLLDELAKRWNELV